MNNHIAPFFHISSTSKTFPVSVHFQSTDVTNLPKYGSDFETKFFFKAFDKIYGTNTFGEDFQNKIKYPFFNLDDGFIATIPIPTDSKSFKIQFLLLQRETTSPWGEGVQEDYQSFYELDIDVPTYRLNANNLKEERIIEIILFHDHDGYKAVLGYIPN